MKSLKPEELSNIIQLKKKGKFKEAIKVIDTLGDIKDFTPQDQVELYRLKSSLFFEIGRFNEALQYIELAYIESQQIENILQVFDVLLYKSGILWRNDRDTEALEVLNEVEELLNSINHLSSSELKEKKAYVFLRKSSICFDGGDLNGSLKYADDCLTIAKELNNKRLVMLAKKRLTFISSTRGEIDQTLGYGQEYLALAKEIEDKQEIIGALNAIGCVYTDKGDFNRALDYLKKSLSLCEEINSWKTGTILTSLFENYMNMNDLDKAQQCLDRMNQINKQEYDKWLDNCYRVGRAMVLKKKSGHINHLKAIEILKQIINEEALFVQTYYLALIHLCDLYLKELNESDDLKILDEIQPYLNRLKDIAIKHRSSWLLVEMYSFQSKLNLLSFKFEDAQELLITAYDIAEKYDQDRLVKRITSEQSELLTNSMKWEKLKESGAKISDRMNLAQIEEQIELLLQKRRYLKIFNN
jgi:tetratricopeptide (TPR) repeat protein